MMGDKLIMSTRELKRKIVLEEVRKGLVSLKEATSRLGVCYRQAKRLKKKYQKEGDKGLVHQNRGKQPNCAYERRFKEKVLTIYRSKYIDCGPTFASEKLEENEDIQINDETLRLWLLDSNLWIRCRRRKSYRQRRERRECFGELLQIDGSDHAWFGADKPRCCLLNIVDDASGTTLSQLDQGETCRVLLSTFKLWVEKYGVPQAVYVDLKSLYVSQSEGSLNVFERVCYLLNVKIIKAYSPQAKGRVERNHGVYQDRFVKELKLRNITTIEAANVFLKNKYLDQINRKFAKEPKSRVDGHCPAKIYGDLEQIFCWEYRRQLNNDFTICFDNKVFQIEKRSSEFLQAKERVMIRIHLNESISIWHQGRRLSYKQIEVQPRLPYIKRGIDSFKFSHNARINKHKTPWSKFNPAWLGGVNQL
jgi:transposase